MSVFDDITLQWDGEEKTVPAHNVMRMIAKVEDHLTLHEMQTFFDRGTAPMVRVSMAYAAALKHAGFKVTDDQVYKRLMESAAESEGVAALEIVHALQTMLVPPSDLDVKASDNKGAKPGKKRAAKSS